jgi:hypothetical protein
MLTGKIKLNFDKKNAQLRVEEKNKKKVYAEHRTCANYRLKPHPQNPNRRQYAQVQPFAEMKEKNPVL